MKATPLPTTKKLVTELLDWATYILTKRFSVNEYANGMNISYHMATRRLNVLKSNKIVVTGGCGKFTYWEINPELWNVEDDVTEYHAYTQASGIPYISELTDYHLASLHSMKHNRCMMTYRPGDYQYDEQWDETRPAVGSNEWLDQNV